MIDFRYHLVSIVAVFLALAIGIVLGSTALQGDTIDGLKAINNSLGSQLNEANAARKSYAQQVTADGTFFQVAEQKLLAGMLPGVRIVLVTEPGASSGVISGITSAATYAGATITGTIALQPKFNDLSGTTTAVLSQINSEAATIDGITLAPAADIQTAYQQDAAQVIAYAVLQQSADQSALTAAAAQHLLKSYADGGYLTFSGTPADAPADRATLAVIVTPAATTSDGPNDPADQVLLALATEFAPASAATLVAGQTPDPSLSASPISVLRGSSASSLVSSVDNADTTLGQISVIWALAGQLQGGKPNSYGTSSGASAVTVNPVPSPVPSATPTPSVTPTPTTTGKVKLTVNAK